jgi:DNA-binding YbaB/EbfC family protein
MQALMQQMQKMQEGVKRAQQEAEAFVAEASAGGGAVTCVVNGKNTLVSIAIKPEAVDPSEVELLQEMIVVAVNAALEKIRVNTEESLKKATGGLNIPGLS